MNNLSTNVILTYLRESEILLHTFVQNKFRFGERCWLSLNEYWEVSSITDVVIPLIGAFSHRLLVRLIYSFSIINLLISLIKWCFPAYRPYWWLKELHKQHLKGFRQYAVPCETSAGFPSTHSANFTAFFYLFVVPSVIDIMQYKLNLQHRFVNIARQLIIFCASVMMWISRLYITSEFAHQCVLGSMLSLVILNTLRRYEVHLFTLSRWKAFSAVLCFSFLPILVYFSMLRMHLDPHWSVRMAFKWCQDPSYLRHELSPIFVLTRDLGYIMGVALSAPLRLRYQNIKSYQWKRILFIVFFELFNTWMRSEIPKNQGRVIFLTYEYFRNAIHSFTLLTIIPKFCN